MSCMNFIWDTIKVKVISVVSLNPIKWKDYYLKNCYLSYVSHFVIILSLWLANLNVALHDMEHRLY